MVQKMSWDSAAEKAEELTQGIIIKLKDGQEIEGVFRGEPVMDRKHFIEKKPNDCIGMPHCPLCNQGLKPNVRWYINFVSKTKDGYSMRIIGLSSTIFNRLNAMRSKIKTPFNRTAFSIQRQGAGTDTDYILTPQGLVEDIGSLEAVGMNNIEEVLERAGKTEDAPF